MGREKSFPSPIKPSTLNIKEALSKLKAKVRIRVIVQPCAGFASVLVSPTIQPATGAE
jgi:hypothetical protein